MLTYWFLRHTETYTMIFSWFSIWSRRSCPRLSSQMKRLKHWRSMCWFIWILQVFDLISFYGRTQFLELQLKTFCMLMEGRCGSVGVELVIVKISKISEHLSPPPIPSQCSCCHYFIPLPDTMDKLLSMFDFIHKRLPMWLILKWLA